MPRDPYKIWLEALERKREPAMREAERLVDTARYDEAERGVQLVDDSIYGAVALGRLFTATLRRLVANGECDGARVEEVFRRALHWKQSAYPEPHTQVEADGYATGRAEDFAELVAIVGARPAELNILCEREGTLPGGRESDPDRGAPGSGRVRCGG